MGKYSIIKNKQETKPRLLVVDDEPDQCDSVVSYFSKRNFLGFSAESGEEALKSVEKNKPDLVLLDMKLAGEMDGMGVLRALRKSGNEVKVLMITGDVLERQQLRELAGLGVVGLLAKPINIEEIEETIKKALESAYPQSVRFETIEPKKEPANVSLRRITHDLANITNDITNKCELYILDAEEGLNKDKSVKECQAETLSILNSVLKQTERLREILKNLSALVRRG